jgi:hypothetical protein
MKVDETESPSSQVTASSARRSYKGRQNTAEPANASLRSIANTDLKSTFSVQAGLLSLEYAPNISPYITKHGLKIKCMVKFASKCEFPAVVTFIRKEGKASSTLQTLTWIPKMTMYFGLSKKHPNDPLMELQKENKIISSTVSLGF